MRKPASSLKQRTLPTVLIIDDVESEGSAAKLLLAGVVKAVDRVPNSVSSDDLDKASLVLVDFRLTDWPQRDRQATPSLKPKDRIALVATLRSNLNSDPKRSPTAFALRSGKLNELAGEFSPERREHAIARMIDMDWVFSKTQDANDFAREVASLATAVSKLPHPWPSVDKSRRTLIRLLGLKRNFGWFNRAFGEVDKSNPPQDAAAQNSKGMALVRWLLHDVLPFPNFLIDERYLAARFHVTPQSMRQELAAKGGKVRRQLVEFEYQGLLHDFSGCRWWRAGVEYWIWRQTARKPFDKIALRELGRQLSPKLRSVPYQNPVVVLDDQFRPTDNLLDLTAVVQINPDDWPNTADPAWASIDSVNKSPVIAARVTLQDRQKLKLP
jgi:hypothetical protein